MKIKDILSKGVLISLSGDVDDGMLKAFDAGLKEARSQEEGTILVMLTSHGGNVAVGHAIAERLHLASSLMPTTIVGATYASSSAVQIFLALPPEHRYVTKSFELMIHPYRRGIRHLDGMVAFDEFERRLEEESQHLLHARAFENRVFNTILGETGIKKAKLKKLYRRSHRFSAKDLVRHKMVNGIIE